MGHETGALETRSAVHFVEGVEAAVAKAQELAGDRMVEVAAGDVGGYFGSYTSAAGYASATSWWRFEGNGGDCG